MFCSSLQKYSKTTSKIVSLLRKNDNSKDQFEFAVDFVFSIYAFKVFHPVIVCIKWNIWAKCLKMKFIIHFKKNNEPSLCLVKLDSLVRHRNACSKQHVQILWAQGQKFRKTVGNRHFLCSLLLRECLLCSATKNDDFSYKMYKTNFFPRQLRN